MERGRRLKPEEIGQLTAALIRSLEGDAVREREHGPVERARLRMDEQRRARDEESLRRDAAERRARVVKSALENVLPPKIYDIVTGPNARMTEVGQLVLDWLDEGKHRVLVIRGTMGTGKSVGAALGAKHAAENGARSISWHRPNDFVSAVLHAYDDDAPKLGKDLVILDDIGLETKAGFGDALTEFLDTTRTRIIATTNDTLLTWKSRYDPRLLERLGDEGVAYTITGESMRQKGWGF